ncbi:ATP-binding protein [Streptomyces sp. MAR4 CNX-425]|uniref:ATP-binding protein n=1 Tax=Streptomyces sp. MAR4 CNX-425 TaxID=3406343 RepID=UPI003B5024AE
MFCRNDFCSIGHRSMLVLRQRKGPASAPIAERPHGQGGLLMDPSFAAFTAGKQRETGRRFPRHARSVGRARTALRAQLGLWGVDQNVADTAVLLVSELVTNAVRHATVPPGREIGTWFALREGRLRLEVADANGDLPQPRTAGDEDESGRGLALVDALADEWGTYRRANGIGKCVWVTLKLPSERS